MYINIGKLIDDYQEGLEKYKFCEAHYEVKYSKDEKEDIMSYNDIMEYMSRDDTLHDGLYWSWREILGHEETPQGHPARKTSSYNLKILWENGEETWEPLNEFGTDSPVECAVYAKKHGL